MKLLYVVSALALLAAVTGCGISSVAPSVPGVTRFHVSGTWKGKVENYLSHGESLGLIAKVVREPGNKVIMRIHDFVNLSGRISGNGIMLSDTYALGPGHAARYRLKGAVHGDTMTGILTSSILVNKKVTKKSSWAFVLRRNPS